MRRHGRPISSHLGWEQTWADAIDSDFIPARSTDGPISQGSLKQSEPDEDKTLTGSGEKPIDAQE